MIVGYKSFSYDGVNQAGEKFEVGLNYHCNGIIKYNHNGFHMAKNFEDTIPFSDLVDEDGNFKMLHDIIIAEVEGSGNIDCVSDIYSDYYGYYDMYACSDMKVIRYLSREELISMALALPDYRMKRFVSYMELTREEISLFYGRYPIVDAAIEYYQKNNKEIYNSNNLQKIYSKYV